MGSAVTIAIFRRPHAERDFYARRRALYGVSVVAFAASPWFRLSIVLMVVIGVANVFCNALVQTVIQTYSPGEFRGRTMAIFQLSNVIMTVGSMLLGVIGGAVRHPLAVGLMGAGGALRCW